MIEDIIREQQKTLNEVYALFKNWIETEEAINTLKMGAPQKGTKSALGESFAKRTNGISVGIEMMADDVRTMILRTEAIRGKPKMIESTLPLILVAPRLLARPRTNLIFDDPGL